MVDPLVLGPPLKALVLLAEVPVALDLVAEHPMVAALMVDQVIVAPEAMVLPAGDLAETQALTAEARVMTDHPAMETVGPPVVAMAVVMAEATAVVMAVVMAAVMAVAMAEAMVVVTAAETNRSYQKETPPFPLACDERRGELSANASTIRTLPESFMKLHLYGLN